MTTDRDQFGRLKVDEATLAANAIGCMVAASLRVESIEKLLGCSREDAEAFREGAHADLARIRTFGRTPS